jgi:hypothetical protein
MAARPKYNPAKIGQTNFTLEASVGESQKDSRL